MAAHHPGNSTVRYPGREAAANKLIVLRRVARYAYRLVYLAKAVGQNAKLRILLRGFLQRLANTGHPIAFAVDERLNSLL